MPVTEREARREFRGARIFSARTLETLTLELNRFASEVADAWQRIASGVVPRWDKAPLILRANGTLAFGTLTKVSPNLAAIILSFPPATSQDAGRSVRFARMSTAFALTVRAPTPVSIDAGGSTQTVPSNLGLYEYQWDGEAWWRLRG